MDDHRRPAGVHAAARRLRRRRDDETGGGGEELTKLGKGEGEVDLIAWAGYVEDPWSKPFEEKTGCKVKKRVAGTSDEMVSLMRTGEWDGVSASGNATARLFEGGDVAPVNTDLVPNYKTVFPDIKDQPYNTFDGQPYGIPHGRGANLLMWNSNEVKPAPKSWSITMDPKEAAKYKGKISQYDDPMSIAEAALYLKMHEPDLGIEDPYELNEEQFEAAVDLMKEQRANVGEYWSEAEKQISAFANGDIQVGTTWQYQYFAAERRRQAGRGEPREPGLLAGRGCDGLVGHLDDQLRSPASQLHVHVDELGHRTESERRNVLNSSARLRPRKRPAKKPKTRTSAPNTTRKTRISGNASTTGRRRSRTVGTAKKIARTTTTGSRPGPRSRVDHLKQ